MGIVAGEGYNVLQLQAASPPASYRSFWVCPCSTSEVIDRAHYHMLPCKRRRYSSARVQQIMVGKLHRGLCSESPVL